MKKAAVAKIVVAAFLMTVATDAWAIVRYMVQGMTCAEVQESVSRDGVAILYRHGEAGITLYDRFVKDGSFCSADSTTARERIAVADTDSCNVAKCVEARRFGR